MKAINFNDEELEESVDLGEPTKEEYEQAKESKKLASDALWLSRKRKDELIDALAKERESEKFYMELYEKHRGIIRKYEIYEELEANG
jgi:hypothetical protein